MVLNDRLGKKIRVKCNEDDTIGDLKKLVAAQTGECAKSGPTLVTRARLIVMANGWLLECGPFLCRNGSGADEAPLIAWPPSSSFMQVPGQRRSGSRSGTLCTRTTSLWRTMR